MPDERDQIAEALRIAQAAGARDAMLHLHAAVEIEARAGLLWWCALFAMLDALGRGNNK